MPRGLRERAEGGIYHVMVRGNNKQKLFYCDQDFERYLNYMKKGAVKWPVRIHCYVIMPNHVHLLLKNLEIDGLSKFMHGLQTAYGVYFNKRNKKVGHVFQGRFQSKPVSDDIYFIYLSKYIHLNPVSAGLVESPRDYQWSSYSAYVNENLNGSNEVVDVDFLKSIFSDQFSPTSPTP